MTRLFGDSKNPLASSEGSRMLCEAKGKSVMKNHSPGCSSGEKYPASLLTEIQIIYTSVLTYTLTMKKLIGN